MNLNKNGKLYIFLKKNLPLKVKHYLYFLMHFKNNLKIKIPHWIFKFLITKIYDENNNKLFTLRNFGGSTISRGFSMFRSQPELCEWINKFEKSSVFVDVGANIGLYSLYAAKKGHRVIALEPESLNFACLNLNIKDNNFKDKISAFPIAVNDELKISYLNMHAMKFGGSGNTFERKINDHGNQFDSIFSQGSVSFTLDDFLEKTNIVPNYIKIDVDGNELKVIKGMSKVIQDENLKSICIELNPKFDEHAEVFQVLEKYFKKKIKHNWYDGQEVFNHTFYRI